MSKKVYNNTVSNFKQIRRKDSLKSIQDDDSLTYLKNRVTYEKLKENLNSPLFTTTSRDGLIFKETTCETEKNSTLKSTLKKMVQLKKHRIQLSRELVSQKEGMSKKEKIRLELENEFLHHKFENNALKDDISSNENILAVSKENFSQMNLYCERLKTRFKDFVETVDKYEDKIKSSKKEKEEMVKKYEANLAVLSK
jgi:hypothetical protein